MDTADELIFGERYEDLVHGLAVTKGKGFELDEDWTWHLRRPLMLWEPEVWPLGRAVRRAEASLPNGIQLFSPPPEPGLHILSQRHFDAYLTVMAEMMNVAIPRILTEARQSHGR